MKKEKADLHIIKNFIFDEKKYNEIKVFHENKETIINIVDLRYKYPGYNDYVLKNINLEIKKGDFIVVCGQNGSGKTTLMKIIAGILPFKEGKIIKLKNNLKTGYIYQNPDNQIFAETVFDEVSFVLKMANAPFDIIKQKTESILKVMGLFEKKDEDPFSLPKGDRQKIACASILIAEPDVLILDEPTTGLDYPTLKNLMNVIESLNKKGITVLMITHDMEIAANYGNKMLIMNEGEILFYSDKRKAFENDEILKKAKIKTTDIMDVTLSANGRLLLNEKEFLLCWGKK